jgi:hypothetical protein
MDILFLRIFQSEFGVHPIMNSWRYKPKHSSSKTLTCCLINQTVCASVCQCVPFIVYKYIVHKTEYLQK